MTSPLASPKVLPSSRQSASPSRSTLALSSGVRAADDAPALRTRRRRPARERPGRRVHRRLRVGDAAAGKVTEHLARVGRIGAGLVSAGGRLHPLPADEVLAPFVSAGNVHVGSSTPGAAPTQPRSQPFVGRRAVGLRPDFLRRERVHRRKCALRTSQVNASVRAPLSLTQGIHVRRDLQALLARPGHRPGHREHAHLHPRHGHRLQRALGGRRAAGRARRQEGARGGQGGEGDARPHARATSSPSGR